jgi:hypothetical protein
MRGQGLGLLRGMVHGLMRGRGLGLCAARQHWGP